MGEHDRLYYCDECARMLPASALRKVRTAPPRVVPSRWELFCPRCNMRVRLPGEEHAMSANKDDEIATLASEVRYQRSLVKKLADILRRSQLTLRTHNPVLWEQAKKLLRNGG